MAYFGMPAQLRASVEAALGMDVAEGLAQNWNLVVLSCMLFGIIVIINAMNSVYKRYRFNRPDYMDGAILKFVSGILLVNINWLVMAVVSYA